MRHSEFVVGRVRAAIEADPPLGGRLALWGRRLMGEALSQAQRVAADREALIALVAGGVDRPGLTSPRWAGSSPASRSATTSGWAGSASPSETEHGPAAGGEPTDDPG